MSYNNVAEKWTTDPDLRAELFCDVADATHPDGTITVSEMVGTIPCVRHYAPKTQGDILRALIQKMKADSWSGDRLVRVIGGRYRWECRDWSQPDAAASARADLGRATA